MATVDLFLTIPYIPYLTMGISVISINTNDLMPIINSYVTAAYTVTAANSSINLNHCMFTVDSHVTTMYIITVANGRRGFYPTIPYNYTTPLLDFCSTYLRRATPSEAKMLRACQCKHT